MSPGRRVLIWGAKIAKATEPRFVEMRGTNSPRRLLEVMVTGALLLLLKVPRFAHSYHSGRGHTQQFTDLVFG